MRVDIDVDLQGWRPTKGQVDKHGEIIEDRIYNQKDFDTNMVIDEQTERVASDHHQLPQAHRHDGEDHCVLVEDIDLRRKIGGRVTNSNVQP